MALYVVVFSAIVVAFLAGSSDARDPYPIRSTNNYNTFRSMNGIPGIPESPGAFKLDATSTRGNTACGRATPSTADIPGRSACSYTATLIFSECRSPSRTQRDIPMNVPAQFRLEQIESTNETRIVGPPANVASVTNRGGIKEVKQLDTKMNNWNEEFVEEYREYFINK